jgi:hypothetical protein
MYNIHRHYENVFSYLTNIVTHPRVFYLHPYGSTQPENIESVSNFIPNSGVPINFIFYDQEPIIGTYNYQLFDYFKQQRGKTVLVTTEKNSAPLDHILKKYNWPSVYYFHHAFAAHDWFRGSRYSANLVPIKNRTLKKKYISFNRLTSHARVYRALLISELYQRNILDQGYVSFNDVCPYGGNYRENLNLAVKEGYFSQSIADQAVYNIDKIQMPLRIDFKNESTIPNHSYALGAMKETQESFCYVVTETCYWESKHHLTEKIFKPIISQMPFILVGPANNLQYLKEYGFKTFSPWINEDYDHIQDPIRRMLAVGQELERLCSFNEEELKQMLIEMTPILEHNYNLFYSHEFLDFCHQELLENLSKIISKLQDYF